MGTLIHSVLANLLRKSDAITPASIRAETDAHLPSDLATVYRQSLRQRAVGAVLTYEREFRVDGWRFAGAETIVQDSALDLVWVTSAGLVYADEIKTGLNARLFLDQLTSQCAGQYAAGIQVFGPRFSGVRAILLAERRSGMYSARSRGEIAWTA